MYNHVKTCYKTLIDQNLENGKLREKFGEFLWEIGEFENSKTLYNEAIGIYASNLDDNKI